MDKNKIDMKNVKGKISGLEGLVKQFLPETFTVAAVVVAVISSSLHLFVGSLGWAAIFVLIGCALGVYLPLKVDEVMKKVYSFSKDVTSSTGIISEIVKIAVALFVPFIYFGFLGAMAGTAFNYYLRK